MDKQYFDFNETTDYEKLIHFNQQTNIFSRLDQAPEKHYFDASGDTRDGRKCHIEMKARNAILTDDFTVSSSTFNSDDLFIEDHKYADNVLDAICFDSMPLYINFLMDGHTIIFHLLKLKRRPKRYQNMIIESKGYGKMEIANRQGLYITDAAIYNKDGKLIHKPLK